MKRMRVAWGGHEEFSEEIDIEDYDSASQAQYAFREGKYIGQPLTSWLSEVPSDIEPWTPVYAWDGDERPEHPRLGYFMGWGKTLGTVRMILGNSDIFQDSYEHIEPVIPRGGQE